MTSLAALAILTVALVLLEATVVAHGVPGTSALAGVAGCLAIVVGAKWLGKRWLQRSEDADGG